MKINDAKKLFKSIILLIEDCEALSGEGNSGEFHDRKIEAMLIKNAKMSYKEFIKYFKKSTGFTPEKYFICYTREDTYTGIHEVYMQNWKFKEDYSNFILDIPKNANVIAKKTIRED